MTSKKVKTYCRFCHAYCPMVATVQDNQLLALAPDTDNPVYGGYTCVKGRQMLEQIDHPTRVQRSQKRLEGGDYAGIDTPTALDEIADKLRDILEKHGPRSIASYNGTYSYQNSAAHDMARAFHSAIDSPSYYASLSIDQPAKVAIGPARMGWWNAGSHMWFDSDVALIIGNNTLVSHYSIPGGVPSFSPYEALREGKKRGMKLICVDPRRTEVAARSDLHLQVTPGQDAALLAAMIRVILDEDLYDTDFCQQHTQGLEQLKQAVSPFTPARVAAAAGIPAAQILEAARLFGAGPRGSAVSGTGPEMGPHPNLVQHLVQALNAICGRHYREGERLPNPGVLNPPMTRRAQATSPQPQWLTDSRRTRVSNELGEIVVLSPYGPLAEMPSAILADEILTPGEGQIKALICVGGNPLLALPDQQKTFEALSSLELLVCIDIKMSATAKLADYVLAPKMCLEREDVTLLTDIWHPQPYSQYTPAVVEAQGDKIEEWEFFWETGKRLGLQLELRNGAVDMDHKPTKFDLLANLTAGSRVPLEDIRANDGGRIFDAPDVIIEAADPATRGRLELFPAGLADELEAAETDMQTSADQVHSHLLISRRMKHAHNSTGPELSLLAKKGTTNPAFMHSSDLDALGIADGDLIEVCSDHAAIAAVAAASDDIKPGVISMSHCWGGSPDPAANTDSRVREVGSNTNRLIDNQWQAERYSGMPRQSSIPVSVRKTAP